MFIMEKEKMDIELRSDEFQEIIQQWPRWMIRSGIMLILGLTDDYIGRKLFLSLS